MLELGYPEHCSRPTSINFGDTCASKSLRPSIEIASCKSALRPGCPKKKHTILCMLYLAEGRDLLISTSKRDKMRSHLA